MKAYASIVVGQEVDGKNLVVKIEKVSCNKEVIENILKTSKNNWVEQFDVPEGKVPMYFSRNPQEILIEDVEYHEET
jgi:hypothetical protein